MNKYLLMCAAAAWATTAAGAAQAGAYSVHFVGSTGVSYCDGEIGVSTASYAAGQHVYSHCPSSTFIANLETVGLISKGEKATRKKGKKAGNAAMSDTTFAVYDGTYSLAVLFELETPIAAGGNWDVWVGVGDSGVLGHHGVLAAGQYAKVPGKTAESSVAKLVAALETRKTFHREAVRQ